MKDFVSHSTMAAFALFAGVLLLDPSLEAGMWATVGALAHFAPRFMGRAFKPTA